MVGNQLMTIISSFTNSHASLVVEGVHLNIDLMLKIVQTFPNVVPFLIYIKKEDFHRQRFAVRAKYMTTDPSSNRYISNFAAIRYVQSYLSKGANQHLLPKIDNRNIDRSLETMHQTLFSYLKKLEGRNNMYDPSTERLTFLDSIWHRRKQKLTSKAKSLKMINSLKNENSLEAKYCQSQPVDSLKELLKALPVEGEQITSDDPDEADVIKYLKNGTMLMSHVKMKSNDVKPEEKQTASEIKKSIEFAKDVDFGENDDGEIDDDTAEVTLTDFVETTDSENIDLSSILISLREKQNRM